MNSFSIRAQRYIATVCLSLTFCIAMPFAAHAQDDTLSARLKKHIMYLASDQLAVLPAEKE